jgi:hypothetical protein
MEKNMTVKELIKELLNFNQNAEIYVKSVDGKQDFFVDGITSCGEHSNEPGNVFIETVG